MLIKGRRFVAVGTHSECHPCVRTLLIVAREQRLSYTVPWRRVVFARTCSLQCQCANSPLACPLMNVHLIALEHHQHANLTLCYSPHGRLVCNHAQTCKRTCAVRSSSRAPNRPLIADHARMCTEKGTNIAASSAKDCARTNLSSNAESCNRGNCTSQRAQSVTFIAFHD